MTTPSKKPDLTAFVKSLRKSHSSSRAGTKSAARINVLQTHKLRPFTVQERAGEQA